MPSSDPLVCDASPLIVLAKSDLLQILPALFSEVLIPEAVLNEIVAGAQDDSMRSALPHCLWLKTVRLHPPLSPLSTWQFGLGEAEVIEYARTHGNLQIALDDRAGRRAAQTLRLKVHGTLGLVALGVKAGYVQSFAAAVAQLKSHGLYVTEMVVEEVNKTLK